MQDLISTLNKATANGARFISFDYTTKGSGEHARYTFALGVNVERAYRRDLSILRGLKSHLSGVALTACEELIESRVTSLKVGIGNNPAYTCRGVYSAEGKGVKTHDATGELHVFGFQIAKVTIAEGTHKSVNSSPKTIAKRQIEKRLKTGRFRQFAVSNVHSIKVDGKHIILLRAPAAPSVPVVPAPDVYPKAVADQLSELARRIAGTQGRIQN